VKKDYIAPSERDHRPDQVENVLDRLALAMCQRSAQALADRDYSHRLVEDNVEWKELEEDFTLDRQLFVNNMRGVQAA